MKNVEEISNRVAVIKVTKGCKNAEEIRTYYKENVYKFHRPKEYHDIPLENQILILIEFESEDEKQRFIDSCSD